MNKFFIFLALSIFLISCSNPQKSSEEAFKEISVPVIETSKEKQPDVYETIGTLKSKRSVSIATRISGFITGVYVSAGDKVHIGQLLIQIDDNSLVAAKDEALANFNLAQATFNRYKSLLEKNSISQQEFDEVEAQLRLSEAALKNTNSNLSYARIVSPINGVVTSKSVETGDLVNPGALLLRLDETSNYEVEAVVEEAQMKNIKVGDEARIKISAYDKRLKAKVTEIVPEVDTASRSFIVKLEPDSETLKVESLELRSGMHSKVCMKVGEKEILSIPETALINRGQLNYVYALDEKNHAKLRLVKLGKYIEISSDTDGALALGSYEILSGLEEGEKIISDEVSLVNEGDKISAL